MSSFRLYVRPLLLGFALTLTLATVAVGQCVPSPTVLCLQSDRFQVEVEWEDFDANTGQGQVLSSFSNDTGFLWFVDAELAEIFVKVIDGTVANGHYWVFFASLTNWEYTLTVTDTDTAAVVTYTNVLGTFSSVTDVMAFPVGPAPPASELPADYDPLPAVSIDEPNAASGAFQGVADPCAPSDTVMCLDGGRFQVELDWVTGGGSGGSGQVVPLTDKAGAFWFFDPSNLEITVKIFDGGAENGNFWFYYGALASVEYTITVTDVCSGSVREYTNPQGMLTSTADFAAFPSTGTCVIFTDGFESGNTDHWSSSVGD